MFPAGSCGGHCFPFGLTVLGRLEKLEPTWRKQVTRVGPCGYLVAAFFTLSCCRAVMAHWNPLSRRLWILFVCFKGSLADLELAV